MTTRSQDAETPRHPERAVATMPEVIEAWPVTGGYDAVIRAAVGGTAGYEQPQAEKIRRLPGLHHTRAGFARRRLEQGRTPAP